jgi:hypothetical protein
MQPLQNPPLCSSTVLWKRNRLKMHVDNEVAGFTGEETEINLRQFSRKVEIKGFNRERIEKERRCFINNTAAVVAVHS